MMINLRSYGKPVLFFHKHLDDNHIYFKVDLVNERVTVVRIGSIKGKSSRITEIKLLSFLQNYTNYLTYQGIHNPRRTIQNMSGKRISQVLKFTTENQYNKAFDLITKMFGQWREPPQENRPCNPCKLA